MVFLKKNSVLVHFLPQTIFFLFLGTIVCGALCFWKAFSSHDTNANSLPLSQMRKPLPLFVPASKLDFGGVWEDESFVWTLPIQNCGSEALKIQKFVSSCACIRVEPKSLEIPAQATCPIQLTFNLTWRKAKTETVWPFSAEVTALADSQPVRQKTWTLCGKVRKSFDIVPERVSFLEENLIQGQSFPSLTVEVSPQTELTGLAAECRPPLGRVVVAPSKKKLTFSVTVTPKQDLAVGNFEFDVVLRGHTKGTVLPPVPLRVIGKVLQEVEVIPPAVLFGHGVLGEQSEEILMLRSRIGKKLRVLSFQSSSESTKIGPLKESPDSSPQFRIQQSFLMTGQQSATITFFALIDDRRITLAVPVRYFGLSKTTEDGKGLQ